MFGAKRKARKIRVSEDNEDHDEHPTSGTTEEQPMNDGKSLFSRRNVIVKPVFFADGREKTKETNS